ncbi:hypothetical protein IFM89_016392 [Coptis chinensis]|uniref:Uncharacterized protein n=1 Tax=Coptis chinensis TaxID=261450 RepID=A0A835LRW8_9MAGN|nr:hypothetical protein IFM89_016392 [Coptis chinensis]
MASTNPSSPSPSPQPKSSPSPPPPTTTPSLQQQQPNNFYPLSSSGRGFIPPATNKTFRPQQPTDQLVTVANPRGNNGYRPRSSVPQFNNNNTSNQTRPNYGLSGSDSPNFGSNSASGTPKASPYPSTGPELNGYRDSRDRSRDDTVVTIHDRKVRLSDGASLYALCRSWVRNGLPKETQPQFGEGLKLLPRPLPVRVANSQTTDRNESCHKEEKEEDATSVEHLSACELLQRHVKRAKKVRARLRDERLQRIERYKQRLALLLPSPVEHFRSDAATDN